MRKWSVPSTWLAKWPMSDFRGLLSNVLQSSFHQTVIIYSSDDMEDVDLQPSLKYIPEHVSCFARTLQLVVKDGFHGSGHWTRYIFYLCYVFSINFPVTFKDTTVNIFSNWERIFLKYILQLKTCNQNNIFYNCIFSGFINCCYY